MALRDMPLIHCIDMVLQLVKNMPFLLLFSRNTVVRLQKCAQGYQLAMVVLIVLAMYWAQQEVFQMLRGIGCSILAAEGSYLVSWVSTC